MFDIRKYCSNIYLCEKGCIAFFGKEKYVYLNRKTHFIRKYIYIKYLHLKNPIHVSFKIIQDNKKKSDFQLKII